MTSSRAFHPSFVCAFPQYDFVELLDGSRLISNEHRALSETERGARPEHQVVVHQAGFIQYLDTGVWHLAFYNDGRSIEAVSYNTIIQGKTVLNCKCRIGGLYFGDL